MIAGPVGVQHLRTFKKFLKASAVKVRAVSNIGRSPGWYSGFVNQLQQRIGKFIETAK